MKRNEYCGYIYLIYDQKYNKVYIGKRQLLENYDIESYYGSGTIIKRIIKTRGKYFLKKRILIEFNMPIYNKIKNINLNTNKYV